MKYLESSNILNQTRRSTNEIKERGIDEKNERGDLIMMTSEKINQQHNQHVKMYLQHLEILKNKHHISWKNHNIEQYIEQAFQQYLKKQEKKK